MLVWYLLPAYIALIVLAFVVWFALMWFLVVWLISVTSGWQRYAQKYRALQPASGRKWEWQYGLVNRARYGNALNLTANDEGLFLEPVSVFRINHPPLFIPWQEFHDATPVTHRWRELLQVQVGTPSMGTMSLPPAVFVETAGRMILEDSFIKSGVKPLAIDMEI